MYGSDRGSYGGQRRSFDGPRRSFAPVNVGDELDVKIEAVGEKGDGVAKVKGFVLFVPGVKAGDEVHIKVTRVLKKVGFAEVVGAGAAKTEEASEEATEERSEGSAEENSEDSEDLEEAEEDSEEFGDEE